MKTLYIECNMGVAGDMLTAALLDLLEKEQQEEFAARMNQLIPGVTVQAVSAEKCGIKGLQVHVKIDGQEEHTHDSPCGHLPEHNHEEHEHEHHHAHEHHHHDHSHGEHHHHASMEWVHTTIEAMELPNQVKQQALAVYEKIAQAESTVHGCPVDQIHFHEVGALDAVADVVGVCVLMDLIAPQQVVVSPIHVGAGQVHCAHGVLPVPAPATALLLNGVPSYSGTIQGELCTPTGAALVKTFASKFGSMPVMVTEKIGVGAGNKDFEAANIVRVFLGETAEETETADEVVELRCNLDDMTGEAIGYACELLRQADALDVYTVPMQMKKSRPAVMLCCICRLQHQQHLTELMLRHTTTWGVRMQRMQRCVLKTSVQEVKTRYGTVRVKQGTGYGIIKRKVEYADAAEASSKSGVTIEAVQNAVNREFEQN